MNLSLRNLLLSKHVLKVNALLLGYWLWIIISNNHTITMTYTVPLTFYGNDAVSVEAPEHIEVKVRGTKKDLLLITSDELAIHCNTDLLPRGKFPLSIDHTSLLLPDTIKMVHYSPLPLIITINNDKHPRQGNELSA